VSGLTDDRQDIPASARTRVIVRTDNGPRLHFIGICGKGMGAIAAALALEGWQVTGSDEQTYPPMNRFLDSAGIPVSSPYAAHNVPANADVVIVGKRVRPDNPELIETIRRGIPYCSFPAFIRDGFLARSRNAVVAGGVGKTTTTAMLTWILEAAGMSPDFLIGGQARNLDAPARFKGADVAVLEGDEYASCFDDASPKFLKYNADVAIITNVLEDHPDLYLNGGAVEEAFRDLVKGLPSTGRLIIPDDDAAATSVASASPCPVHRVGFSRMASGYRIEHLALSPQESRFRLNAVAFTLPLAGRMNIRNAAMTAVAAEHLGVPLERSAEALASFLGVAHRQDSRDFKRATLVVDKASHPQSLRCLFESARQSYPGRRIVSLIRPRATGGRLWVYQRHLPSALAMVDLAVVLPAYEHNPEPGRSWPGGPFSMDLLHREIIQNGGNAVQVSTAADLPGALQTSLRTGDVVVVTVPEQDTELTGVVSDCLASMA